MVKAQCVCFVYSRAASGAKARDAAFATNLEGARAAGMRYGPIHVFNLCDRASDQATLFLSTVPRDNAMLPPVVRPSFIPKCKRRPARAAVLSELNTFLNLIEAHMGQLALIRVSRDFDAAYKLGEGLNRTLWLQRIFLQPDYASRPWVTCTASTNPLPTGTHTTG